MFNSITGRIAKVFIQAIPLECVTNVQIQDLDAENIVKFKTRELTEADRAVWTEFKLEKGESVVGCYGYTDDRNAIVGLGFVIWTYETSNLLTTSVKTDRKH